MNGTTRLSDSVRFRNAVCQRQARERIYEALRIGKSAKVNCEVDAHGVNGMVMVAQLIAKPVLYDPAARSQSALWHPELEPDWKLPIVRLGLGF